MWVYDTSYIYLSFKKGLHFKYKTIMIKHYICDVLSGNMAKSGLILIWKALVACKIRHICNLVGQDINVFVWLPSETAPKCIVSPTFLTPHQPGHPLPLPPLQKSVWGPHFDYFSIVSRGVSSTNYDFSEWHQRLY